MAVNYSYNWQKDYLWIMVLSWFASAFMSFGLGANDCASSYGTSVGSGVLTLRQAYMLATVFEVLGAAMLGYKVTESIRKLIVDVTTYDIFAVQNATNGMEVCLADSCNFNNATFDKCSFFNNNTDFLDYSANWTSSPYNCYHYSSAPFMLGEFCSLLGAAIWLIGATYFKAPVSTTHSAVGATIGFSLVLKGSEGVAWSHLLWKSPMIIPSWVISPVLSGIISVLLYIIVRALAFHRKDPFKASLQMLPFFYFGTVAINVFAIVYDGSKFLGFDKLSWWEVMLIAVGLGVIIGVGAYFIIVPRVRDKILKKHLVKATPEITLQAFTVDAPANGNATNADKSNLAMHRYPRSFSEGLIMLKDGEHEDPKATQVFSALQIMSAAFMSFTHGANDTSNGVAALVAVWLTYRHDNALTDEYGNEVEWFNVYGAIVMVIGLWIFGHKVMERVGKDITEVTPASGFCMQLATGFTVLFASKLGIPVSTTHCLIGSITFIGLYRFHKVDVKVFSSIIAAWLVTLPIAGGLAALLTWAMHYAI